MKRKLGRRAREEANQIVTGSKTWNRRILPKAKGLGALGVLAAIPALLGCVPADEEFGFGGDGRLDIGVLAIAPHNPAGDYFPLALYLQDELSSRSGAKNTVRMMPVESAGASAEAVASAREAIETKDWDVAFTTSPILSTVAENNGYTFVARMFPEVPQFELALVTRADSDLRSFDDIATGTRIALDNRGSELFYMSLYDLYGLTLRVDLGNTLEEIARKVKAGEVDVGASVLAIAKEDPELHILYASRALPLSSVYVSPELTAREQDLVRELLLDAPEEARQQARYDAGQAIDYTHFQKVVSRAEEISKCTDWKTEVVPFYCRSQEILGTLTEYEVRDGAIRFLLEADDGQTYRVIIPIPLLSLAPPEYEARRVQIKNAQMQRVDGMLELTISEVSQLQLE